MADQPLPDSSLSPSDSFPGMSSPTEEKSVKRGLTTFYTLAWFGSWIALITPIAVTMALRVQQIDPAGKETSLGLILGAGALMPVFVTPLVGLLSDRTTSRLGMRRPWLLGGAVLGFLSLLLVATVPTIPLLLLSWCLTQMMFSVTGAAMGAIIPDHIPEHQRGKLSGLTGMAQQLGTVIGIVIATVVNGNLFLAFMIPASLGLLGLLPLAYFMPDRYQARAEIPTLDLLGFVKSFWISPRRYPDFAWAFVSRFLVSFGLAVYSNYTVYFLQNRLHVTAAQVTSLLLVGVLVTVVTTTLAAVLSGIVSDRLRRRKIFVIVSALLYMVGAAIVAFANSFPVYLIGGGLAGAAIGAYSAVDMAMITQLLPANGANAAKDMGVFGIASVLPQSLAPATAPLFLAIGGT
ncbi:MAG: MFS transporter, partial [Ktedonobacteraceae bacterium]|nr:MFS transporter [Ktedonobacteraceae bacterium]